MCAKRQDFQTSNSSFWRQSSGAIPGRVNLSKSGAPPPGTKTSSSSAAAHSFNNFQESVSDAWDIEEPLTPPVKKVDRVLESVHNNRKISSDNLPPAALPRSNQASALAVGVDKKVTSVAASPSSSSNLHNATGSVGSRQSSSKQPASPATCDQSRVAKFEKVLGQCPVNMSDLETLSWSGVPQQFRTKVWKMLCGYLPAGKSEQVIQRKREEYAGYLTQYFHNKEDIHKDTFRQISIDVPRMSPLVSLFQQKCVQEMVERILYIWSIRHPASGYVQGINDLVTPFLMVFLQDFVDSDVTRSNFEFSSLEERVRKEIEADSFWCMTKVLDGIQDNYTFAQPGIQIKIKQLEELLKRVDSDLHNHIVLRDVQYLQFSFRWMNNLLLRELPLTATIRLWDTYLAEKDGFSKFHLYVCAAFLIRWKPDLIQRNDFQSILLFIQNVPTAKWGDSDISLLVAEAYRLKYTFADAPNHLPECRIKTTL